MSSFNPKPAHSDRSKAVGAIAGAAIMILLVAALAAGVVWLWQLVL